MIGPIIRALFGILIAFELDSWRERSNPNELVAQAFERFKTEVRINQNSLHSNVRDNLRKIDALKRVTEKVTESLMFNGTSAEADSINTILKGLVFIEIESADRKSGLFPIHPLLLFRITPLHGNQPKLPVY